MTGSEIPLKGRSSTRSKRSDGSSTASTTARLARTSPGPATEAIRERKFGKVQSASSVGAQGPMRFIPSTWAANGLGGYVHDPHDAILGAANYLRASGAPENYRLALYHYNPVPEYVDSVMRYARQMTRDPRTFYAYYNWQVFVLTKHGEVRLTGPGR